MLDATEQGASMSQKEEERLTSYRAFLALRFHSIPLIAHCANILGQRELTGGCAVKDIQVTGAFVLRCAECMADLKEYLWDAKGNTYGSRSSNSDGGGDYIGGDTFMDHGRA
jgi:hypothetical protein